MNVTGCDPKSPPLKKKKVRSNGLLNGLKAYLGNQENSATTVTLTLQITLKPGDEEFLFYLETVRLAYGRNMAYGSNIKCDIVSIG